MSRTAPKSLRKNSFLEDQLKSLDEHSVESDPISENVLESEEEQKL